MRTWRSKLAASVVLLSTSSYAWSACADWFQICPYVGADVQARYSQWQQGLGNGNFKKWAPEGDAYAGVQFNQYLGLEGGYEATTIAHRNFVVPTGQIFVNTNIVAFPPTAWSSRFQAKGWYGNLVGMLPVSDCYRLSLIGTVGIVKLRVFHDYVQTADSLGLLDTGLSNSTRGTHTDRHYIPKLGIGGAHMLTDCVGVRLMYNWERTARFKNLPTLETFPVGRGRVSMKNSQSGSVGLFAKF